MSPYRRWRERLHDRSRRGVIIVLMTFLMIATMAMAALAIDVGLIVLTQAQLTNAVDAAVLSASLELKSEDLDAATIQQNAINVGKATAALNFAAGRSVEMLDSDFEFGSRTMDGDDFVTTWGAAGFTNAVRATVAFDQAGGSRAEVDLYFGRVLGLDSSAVSASSTAAISPRDLIFVLDVSGSMQDDTSNGSYRHLLWPYIGTNTQWRPGSDGDVSEVEVSPGVPDYELCWNESSSRGCWGTGADLSAFATQEFGVDAATPWEHWKWRAFCDYALYNRSNWDYNNASTSGANLNVLQDQGNRRFRLSDYANFLRRSELIPAIPGQMFHPRDENSNRDFSDEVTPPAGPFCQFPDASDEENQWYYPAPLPPTGFNYLTEFYGGGPVSIDNWDEFAVQTHGIEIQPMASVRRATLSGIHAMLTDDTNAGRLNWDKIGMVTYGTGVWPDLELTSDIGEAFMVAATRLTMGYGNLSIAPRGNGHTNAGGGLQEAYAMMYRDQGDSPGPDYDPNLRRGARNYTIQVITLLTDGQFNIDTRSQSFNEATYNTSGGDAFALQVADDCANDGIIVHTIGVGDGADPDILEDIANRANGQYFPVDNQDELIDIFQKIGSDKVGELIAD